MWDTPFFLPIKILFWIVVLLNWRWIFIVKSNVKCLHESKNHDHNVLSTRSSQEKKWRHVHVWWCCPIKHCENLFNYILHQLLNKLYHIIQIISIFLWLQYLREWFWISFFKSSISFCLKPFEMQLSTIIVYLCSCAVENYCLSE